MSNRRSANSDFEIQEIYTPESLSEALQIKKRWPEATVWAGGTHLLHAGNDSSFPTLSISGVRELRRLVRSDTHVDIGAVVPIGRLLEVGSRFLPRLLLETIENLGPPPLQNIVTIGGTVCCPGMILPGFLALRLLDARLEVRRQGNTRWIPTNLFNDISQLDPTEIITRIRIPGRPWTHHLSHTFGRPYPSGSESLTVMASAIVDRRTITDIRLAAVSKSTDLVRNRKLEASLIGKRAPLNNRDLKEFEELWSDDPMLQESFSPLSVHRARYSLYGFLERLGRE